MKKVFVLFSCALLISSFGLFADKDMPIKDMQDKGIDGKDMPKAVAMKGKRMKPASRSRLKKVRNLAARIQKNPEGKSTERYAGRIVEMVDTMLGAS